MMLLLLIAQTVAPLDPPAAPVDPVEARYDRCVDLATGNPPEGVIEGTGWRAAGGGFFARQCIGIAYANQAKWASAAEEFEAAAQEAEVARNTRAAQFWAQAGNARLAAGEAVKARAALDAALAAGTLVGLQRGEAQFDRARAMVAAGDLEGARADIDQALTLAEDDPLIWLA
jgi:tetratricopeptide (TPR) repeat protein